MCTVTYIAQKETDFIFTSSRDVPYKREAALFPKEYIENNTKLIYPKDPQGQGSWIGLSEHKHLVCLLNGGFKNHKPNGNYTKSRGLIVKELLVEKNNLLAKAKNINLDNIEPFTIIIVTWYNTELELIELVWTGDARFITVLDSSKNHIWSSATLYTQTMKKQREDWFKTWQKMEKRPILDFHHKAGVGNPKIDVMMDRTTVGTVSISQIRKEKDKLRFYYEDTKSLEKTVI
jgi:hypothetical protein